MEGTNLHISFIWKLFSHLASGVTTEKSSNRVIAVSLQLIQPLFPMASVSGIPQFYYDFSKHEFICIYVSWPILCLCVWGFKSLFTSKNSHLLSLWMFLHPIFSVLLLRFWLYAYWTFSSCLQNLLMSQVYFPSPSLSVSSDLFPHSLIPIH